MSHFNLVLVIPHPRMHGLKGYREIMETVQWGLQALGHEVSISENRFKPGVRNIVFGAQMLTLRELEQVWPDTIVYNLEQLRNLDPAALNPVFRQIAQKFQVWDYSAGNLAAWQQLGARLPVRHVPVGWAPVLQRIAQPPEQDIEVLIYGMPSEARNASFSAMGQQGISCLMLCGLYGPARDALIARAKIVLNASLYTRSDVFEIARVSYLLANRKCVLSLKRPGMFIEADIEQVVAWCEPDTLVQRCYDLLENDAARAALGEAGESAMRQRDIRPLLQKALRAELDAGAGPEAVRASP